MKGPSVRVARDGNVDLSADGWCRAGGGVFNSNPNLHSFHLGQPAFGMRPNFIRVLRIDQNLEELIPGSYRNGIG